MHFPVSVFSNVQGVESRSTISIDCDSKIILANNCEKNTFVPVSTYRDSRKTCVRCGTERIYRVSAGETFRASNETPARAD